MENLLISAIQSQIDEAMTGIRTDLMVGMTAIIGICLILCGLRKLKEVFLSYRERDYISERDVDEAYLKEMKAKKWRAYHEEELKMAHKERIKEMRGY